MRTCPTVSPVFSVRPRPLQSDEIYPFLVTVGFVRRTRILRVIDTLLWMTHMARSGFSATQLASSSNSRQRRAPTSVAALTPWRDRVLLPLQAAAEIAGVSVASLYRFESEGRLTFRRFAGRTLVETASFVLLVDAAEPWAASDRGAEAREARVQRARASWVG